MAEQPYLDTVQEQAALFALGVLPVAEAGPFQQRLNAGCPLCCAEVRAGRQAVSLLPLTGSEVEPPADLRVRLMDLIGGGRGRRGYSVMGEGRLVRPGDTDWEPAPMPGVQVRRLHEGRTMLVRMAPQTEYPAHPHKAAEQCLVLEGSISSGGITAYAGDFTYMPAGSHHDPLYTEAGCLLLIAYT
jgi:ChrR Cupin-like domain